MDIKELTYRWKSISDWSWCYWFLTKDENSIYYIIDTVKSEEPTMVYSDTVWIYTWVKDKDWKKIYTGDEVKNMGRIMEVVFEVINLPRGCEAWKSAGFYCKDEYWQLWCFENDYIEIITN